MPRNHTTNSIWSNKSIYAKSLAIATLGLLLGACAQQSTPGYYDIGRENTKTDAQHRAQGNGDVIAPSQLQIGFGDNSAVEIPEETAAPVLPNYLRETRTYLGTVSCQDKSICDAQRMTVTISPNGQWRARNTDLNNNTNNLSTGCWAITNSNPTRLNLLANNTSFATLEFIQNNVLRVVRVYGQKPLLQAHLTRQADIDPIAEVQQNSSQRCTVY